MPRTRKTPAAEQFTALGIDPDAYTKAMKIAVKQGWGDLPVTTKVGDLRAQLAAVEPAKVPTANELLAEAALAGGNGIATRESAEADHARLAANAKVNAWRARMKLQAALDARGLKFEALQSMKKNPPRVSSVRKSETGDPAPARVAS